MVSFQKEHPVQSKLILLPLFFCFYLKICLWPLLHMYGMVKLSVAAQVGSDAITLHLLHGLPLPENDLQSLLSVLFDVPSHVSIVGLAVRISSVVPSNIPPSSTTEDAAIVVPITAVATTPEYFGENAQIALWLVLYTSDDFSGYYYIDQDGRKISAGNTTEGRGRPMSAASSDRSSGGRRHRPVRTEGHGRPLSAVPSDKNYGGRRLRPTRAEGSGRPLSAAATSDSGRNNTRRILGTDDRRPSTAPASRYAPQHVHVWQPDNDSSETKSLSSATYTDETASLSSSKHSMAVHTSSSMDGSDDDLCEDLDDDREESSAFQGSMPFFAPDGMGVSAWEKNNFGPRTVGLGPL